MFKPKTISSTAAWPTSVRGKASAQATVILAAGHAKTSSAYFSSPSRFHSPSLEFLTSEQK